MSDEDFREAVAFLMEKDEYLRGQIERVNDQLRVNELAIQQLLGRVHALEGRK